MTNLRLGRATLASLALLLGGCAASPSPCSPAPAKTEENSSRETAVMAPRAAGAPEAPQPGAEEKGEPLREEAVSATDPEAESSAQVEDVGEDDSFRAAVHRGVTITSMGSVGDSIPDLASRLMDQRDAVRSCYNKQLIAGARPRGVVKLVLDVDGDGEITVAKVTSEEKLPPSLLECTAGKFAEGSFRPPEHGRPSKVTVFVHYGT